MKPSSSFFNALGVALALSVPAVVVAQQFAANQPLRITDLQALIARVEALEQSGPTAQLVGVVAANGAHALTANAPGFIVATPGGSGFTSIGVQASINSTGRMFRASGGNTLQVIVAAGDVANFTVDGIGVDSSMAFRWYPLHGNGALPSCPTCN